MIILVGLLPAATDEAEERLLLLHGHREDTSAGLEVVLELLVQVQGRLDLDERAELRVVILNVKAALLVLFDESVLPADRNVVDTHVRIVATTQLDLIDVVEVYYVQLLLLLVVIFRRVYLERLDD